MFIEWLGISIVGVRDTAVKKDKSWLANINWVLIMLIILCNRR